MTTYPWVVLLLILSASPWGLSELWGGGVPTSDMDHSGPRTHRLLLLFNLALLPHLFLLPFSGFFFYPYLLTTTHFYPFLFEALSMFTCSTPPILVRRAAHLDTAHTRHPLASAACPCALHRMLASTAVPMLVCSPPLLPSACNQVPVVPWGVFPSRVPPRLCIPAFPTWVLLQILASSGFGVRFGWIFTKRREAKAPPLPVSRAPWSLPPATWPLWRC